MVDTSSKPVDVSNYVTIDGIFVKQDFDHLIIEEDEVSKYTTLTKSTLKQTLYIPFKYDIQVLNFYLNSYFADIKVEYIQGHDIKFTVDDISLTYYQKA